MFAQFCRRVFGGVRLALTVAVIILGAGVVISDICGADVSGAAYTFLGGVLVQVVAFQMMETKRKTEGGSQNEKNMAIHCSHDYRSIGDPDDIWTEKKTGGINP